MRKIDFGVIPDHDKTAYQTTENEMLEPREGRVQIKLFTKSTINTGIC